MGVVSPQFDSERLVWTSLDGLGVCEVGDVGGVELLEFDRGAPAQALWRRCRLWKISRYSKIALASSTRVVHRWRSSSSVCMRAQNDSITALFVASPMVPIEGSSPDSLARWVNAQELNCEP